MNGRNDFLNSIFVKLVSICLWRIELMTLLKKRLLKITPLFIAFLSLWSTGFAQLTDGEDKLYGVK